MALRERPLMPLAVQRASCVMLAMLAAGCMTDEQIRGALTDVNREFRQQYEGILAENGTRVYKAKRQESFSALGISLVRLGMQLESSDPHLGYLKMYAPAPKPLDREEWQKAAERDLPKMRELAQPHVGIMAYFAKFEPEGLQIVINATTLEVSGGTEISLTMRMREVAPPPSGRPRREYPPPTAVRMGLEKIWREVENELKVRGTVVRPR